MLFIFFLFFYYIGLKLVFVNFVWRGLENQLTSRFSATIVPQW